MLTSFLAHGWASSPKLLAVAVVATVGFAVMARALRGVNRSGAVAGGFAGLLLFAGGGPGAFAALAVLFAMTWGATRLGYQRKLALGLAERKEGRTAWQILANLAVAAISAVVYSATGNRVWLLATLAALAEAATDTVASEVGQFRGDRARMITTWEQVPAGTDGGITIEGSVAGLAAGFVMATIGSLGRMISPAQIWIPIAAGFAGMLIDSVLGATLQRRGWISNQGVNFMGTLAAAALAYVILAL